MNVEPIGGALMPLVMLIEDEPVLRSSMARGLARLPDVEVIDAGLFRDAVRLLDAEQPDLIVSDLDLPDGSGVEILGVLDRLGRRIPVIFVTAYLGSFRGQLPNRSDVEVYEKPLPLAQLRKVVLDRIGRETDAPTASPFSLAEYLQLACMGRHSVVLDVEQTGERVGEVRVYRGQIWAAEMADVEGEAAVARLAFGVQGSVTKVRRLVGEPGRRSIQRPWQHILLDAARVHDEESRERPARRPPPAPLRRPASVERPARHAAAPPSNDPPSAVPTRPTTGGQPAAKPESPASAPPQPAPAPPHGLLRPAEGPGAARRFHTGPLPEHSSMNERFGEVAPSGQRPKASATRPPGRALTGPVATARPPSSTHRAPTLPETPAARGSAGRPTPPAKAVARTSTARPTSTRPPKRPTRPASAASQPARPPASQPARPPASRPARPPAPQLPRQQASSKVEGDFDAEIDAGLDAMLVRDYAAAWAALNRANALRPGMPTVLANLARLRQLGFGDTP